MAKKNFPFSFVFVVLCQKIQRLQPGHSSLLVYTQSGIYQSFTYRLTDKHTAARPLLLRHHFQRGTLLEDASVMSHQVSSSSFASHSRLFVNLSHIISASHQQELAQSSKHLFLLYLAYNCPFIYLLITYFFKIFFDVDHF